MSLSKTVLNTLIAGAVVVSLAGFTTGAKADDAAAPEKEKCYGVAKAGANDCADAAKTHSCAAHASASGLAGDFVLVPKGLCDKINGGSTTAAPEAKTDEKKE
ncbi:MAG TPA: DUF2282 domain-containing protein [Patescibacteria group bacterium]|jgi:uncharacterized membrane protein|nr:DUF2282 domain-containing protein [Patescibacteria group bacterium]